MDAFICLIVAEKRSIEFKAAILEKAGEIRPQAS